MINRFKRILVLIKCLLFVFIRGRANKSISKPQNVVVIQLAKMGDMVCTTPIFHAVKKAYSDCRITVVGNKINQELLAGHPEVNNYIVWDKEDPLSVFKEIRKGKFDFGCITSPNFEALAMLFLSGVSLISVPEVKNGWSPYETIPYKILRVFVVVKPHHIGEYAPREYLRLLEPVGIFTNATKKFLVYSQRERKKAEKFLRGNEIRENDFLVGISVSAGNKIKKWPGDRFAQLVDYLIGKHDAKVIILGGKRDVGGGEETIHNIKNKNEVINATNKLSMGELKALISKLKLFISVDTGPIYIAEAFGVPTVDIVGPMDEREQPPIGDRHRVVVPVRKKSELHIMNSRVYNVEEAQAQIDNITLEMVIREVEHLFG